MSENTDRIGPKPPLIPTPAQRTNWYPRSKGLIPANKLYPNRIQILVNRDCVTGCGSGANCLMKAANSRELKLLQTVAGSTESGSTPTDMTLSGNGRFLYVRTGGTGSVHGFRVEADGSLTLVATATGVPGGAQGIAAR